VLSEWLRRDALPPVSFFFTGQALALTLAVVALFRVFDIWKPGPIRRAEHLSPVGVGIMADDVLAGLCAGALAWGVARLV